MMKKTGNTVLLILGLFLIFLSGFQMMWPVFEEKPLEGSFIKSQEPELSAKHWFDESFQQKSEEWLKENFGFRNFYVRLHHQMSFWLFKKAHSEGVLVGKDNVLFEKFYIDALLGKDFKGVSHWEDQVGKLSLLNDSLQKIDKSILILIAPSKAAFYMENIPSHLRGDIRPYNYKYLTDRLREEKVPMIDFYRWFNDMKEETDYPLFPKTGIHWSEYGQFLAGDSIFRFLEGMGYNMPDYVLDSLEIRNTPNKQDADIERAMNLLFTVNREELAYPRYHVVRKDTAKPRGIVIGDSFYWQFMADGMHKDFFKNGEFWYYNRDIVIEDGSKINQSLEYLKKRVEQTDLFVIICSEGGLSRFSWGFIDDLYSLYFDAPPRSQALESSIRLSKQAISRDANWLKSIEKKAQDKGISVDSMMTLDAIFMYEKRKLEELEEEFR